MANPEHVEMLKQGVKVWNRWRKRRPAVGPDLREADLRGAKLSDADFSLALKNRYVILGVVMSGDDTAEVVEQGNALRADLRGARLTDAHLFKANLFGADLSGADLGAADLRHAWLTEALLNNARLRKAQLTGADLRGADLRGANLCEASMGDADLSKAWLSGASFSGAYLNAADFSRAHLDKTDFRKANLYQANFGGAYLHEVDFGEARIGQTTFGLTSLDTAKGLETVMHSEPSIIGLDTIYRSKGNIPEKFLRGCGVPESFIVQIPALLTATQPIQFYSCFLSYSSVNQDFADRLYADLQARGVRCWFAPEDLKIGDRFRDRIDESIRVFDKLLLILSADSVSSPWVGDEVEAAIEREHKENRTVLFPIKIDDAVAESGKAWAAKIRRTRHVGDFTRWKDHDSYRKAFDRLLRDLRAEEREP